jgi:hypothetical protein
LLSHECEIKISNISCFRIGKYKKWRGRERERKGERGREREERGKQNSRLIGVSRSVNRCTLEV